MNKIVTAFVHDLLARIPNVMSVCLVGSRATHIQLEKTSDLDVVVLIDDTFGVDRHYTTKAVKNIGKMVNKIVHCQVFFLTEFWKYITTGSPITYTMLRDATIYYDTGFFENLQKLVKAGLIKPKAEAVERQLSIAKQLMNITYHSVNQGLIQNLQGAVVSSTQSLLMEMGIAPPAPKEVPVYIKKYLVDRHILNDDYYVIARKVIKTYKDIEHKRKAPLSGKELQELYNDTNKFVFKIEEIISKVRSRK